MKREPVLAYMFGLPAALTATACLSQPQEIGKAETVVPSVDSDMAGTVSQLAPGSVIFQDGVIRTYKIGAASLRFVDQTTLTVYPNSSITLDRFVYNPDKTVAEVAFSLLQGAFRLASGGSRTSEKYILQTPHAIFGIRGTVVHAFTNANSSVVQALHGAFEGCSRVSGICKLVKATDSLNGAQFWNDGRVELGHFPPNLGVRRASGGGSLDMAIRPHEIDSRSVEAPPSAAPKRPESPAPPAERPSIMFPNLPSISLGSGASRNPGSTVCFVRGTFILTPDGERRIEDLRAGDRIVTRSAGVQLIKWIPKQVFRREGRRAWGYGIAPISIEKDALAKGCPNRRLILSPAHSLLFGNVLIPAQLLVNQRNIRNTDYSGTLLEYFNVELEQHQIIYANGAEIETYYPATERSREHWSNFEAYSHAYPGEEYRMFPPVAPILHGGRLRLVQAWIRSHLAPATCHQGTLEFVRNQISSHVDVGVS